MSDLNEVDLWEEPDIDQIAGALAPVGRAWWVAGGVALDLFIGHETRKHHDVDIAILEKDSDAFRQALSDWDVCHAAGWSGEPQRSQRVLVPWPLGQERPQGAKAFWCRRQGRKRWSFELLLNQASENDWHFKRDPGISRPLAEICLFTMGGIPYLAPEIVLLHKATSNDFDSEDTRDFEVTLPFMEPHRKEWLKNALDRLRADHLWLAKL